VLARSRAASIRPDARLLDGLLADDERLLYSCQVRLRPLPTLAALAAFCAVAGATALIVSAPAAAPQGSGTQRIADAFPPPSGAERLPRDAFGDWLADLPVVDPSVPVRTYSGAVVGHRARVVDLPMVPGDLQQCADSAIRLRAEWLRSIGGEVAFHATSGDILPWSRWQRGERPVDAGGRIQWRRGTKGGWDEYLARVFTWAGTRSLALDTTAASEPRAGDLLVVPGSPGHAVVLMDVAKRGGETLVLIGEGYMPAQSFHVEIGPEGGWWVFEDVIDLGHITMPVSGLRRWRALGP
jgi:hypothetical protein